MDTKPKEGIDWANLPFAYYRTDYRFVSHWKDGAWDEGKLITDDKVVIPECAGVLQYSQSIFEGLKAFRTVDGRVVIFRPECNAKRMIESAKRLEIPAFPKDRFIKACVEVVKANLAYVPPHGTGAALYLRPFSYGFSNVLGVKPATEYEFRIVASPVGPYFKGGIKPIKVRISDTDRAAPHGTGDVKAGLNYAMSLHNIVDAHDKGFAENIYLDSATQTYLEETGGANIIAITKDGKLITPLSTTILPSITRKSIMQVGKDILGLEVEERLIHKDEIKDLAELGLCGTGAIISPVGQVDDHGNLITLPSGMEKMGPVLTKIRELITGIQTGEKQGPEGWLLEVK